MASACKSLRDYERWRVRYYEKLAEKFIKSPHGVSGLGMNIILIRGCALAGLTDYEVRDLNDEINKLMRKKRHWETRLSLWAAQITGEMLPCYDGKEVPGTKGYK
jgi:pre-mRNA-splicing factor ISY1